MKLDEAAAWGKRPELREPTWEPQSRKQAKERRYNVGNIERQGILMRQVPRLISDPRSPGSPSPRSLRPGGQDNIAGAAAGPPTSRTHAKVCTSKLDLPLRAEKGGQEYGHPRQQPIPEGGDLYGRRSPQLERTNAGKVSEVGVHTSRRSETLRIGAGGTISSRPLG